MFSKRLQDVTADDLRAVVTTGAVERRTFEYKRDLPTGNDAGKKDFVHDAISFANSAGGDVLYGVEEAAGAAVAIPGVPCADFDKLKLWRESVLRDNVARYAHATQSQA